MGLIEAMEKDTESIEAIFQSYITSKSKKDIFLFFEGKHDFKYYSARLSPYIGDREYGVFHCNCKDNVIKIQEIISNQSSHKNDNVNLYFVDKDYDDNENIPNDIYVTEGYSIENYYFTDVAIKRILIGIIGLSEENKDDQLDFETVYAYLLGERDKIIDEIIFSNAWYYLQIRRTSKFDSVPNMSMIKDYNIIKNINEISYLEDLVENAIEVTEDELRKQIEKMKADPVRILRGKYLTQSLTPIFRKIFKDAGRKENRKWFLKKRKIQINLADIISDLSAYADTPKRLISYIESKLLT